MRPSATIEECKITADHLAEYRPEFWSVVHPRRYVTPIGYLNPKVNGTQMAAHLVANQREDAELNKVLIDCLLLDWKLAELKVPTIFPAADFLTDLMHTDPPADYRLKDLLWPHEAMVFVLPESFQKAYFGYQVPFVSIGRVPTGKQYPPECVSRVIRQATGVGLGYAGGFGIIATATVLFGDYGIDYSGSYSEEDVIGEILVDSDFNDHTAMELREAIQQSGYQLSEAEDTKICRKLMSVGLQLVLAMGQLPKHLPPGPVVERPEKRRADGTLKHEGLWKPRVFGGAYVADRAPGPGVGTHASPRLHRRRGHWRREMGWRELPADQKPRMKWINPMWIGADL